MKIELHPPQWKVFRATERFRVLVAGRRFGKTYLALMELCRGAAGKGRMAWYVAPTYKMAKRIAWKPLKELTRPFWASKPNETDLRIELVGGGTICLRGADNYDNLRGEGLDFLVLDEYASIAPEAWTEVLRPALADRQGRALFIGTPQGHNHFHELVERAAKLPDWKAFQYTTAQGGNVPPAELESAAKQLDERVFRQEFEASFLSMGVGRAYYAFDREHNVKGLRYSPHVELCWAIDFNMNPLCSVLVQVSNGLLYVLDEMILPDSNTVAACEELLSRTENWGRGIPITVYGDATGEQRKTSASRTDWQIVKEFFGRHPDRFKLRGFGVPSVNPPVKDRINCMNARLRNSVGQYRIIVDRKCEHLIQDLEQVSWKADPHGNPLAELDKSDPKRTHVSDALGYLVAYEFSMKPMRGEMPGPRPF